MIAGMIVLHQDRPHHVRRIISSYGQAPGVPGAILYELIPVGGGPSVDLRDPAADALVIAPGCDRCGKAPGFTTCHYDGTHEGAAR